MPETGTIIGFKGWHKFKVADARGWLAMTDAVVVNYALHYHNRTEYEEVRPRTPPFPHPPATQLPLQSLLRASAAGPRRATQDMGALMHLLGVHGAMRGKAAVFRETTAQHFIGTGSFASIDQAHLQMGSRCSCGAMSEETAAANEVTALNGVAAAAAAAHPHVRTLRMYDLTKPRHSMHEESYCDYEAEAVRALGRSAALWGSSVWRAGRSRVFMFG